MQVLDLAHMERAALGVERPEGIAESPDGTVWVSDKQSAAAQLHADGSISQVGKADGEPNSLNFLPDGRLLIANFEGTLQVLDTTSAHVTNLVEQVDGRTITHANYALSDANGYIWATESTQFAHPSPETIPEMLANPDGWLFVVRPDGSAEILAEGLSFANGLCLSPDGTSLYVAETFTGRISRADIHPGGGIGPLRTCFEFESDDLTDEAGHPGADGMTFDEQGNLWICVYNRNALVAVSPNGTTTTVLSDPDSAVLAWPTNPVFVGRDRRDLMIGSIYKPFVARTRVDVTGAHQPYRIPTPAGR